MPGMERWRSGGYTGLHMMIPGDYIRPPRRGMLAIVLYNMISLIS